MLSLFCFSLDQQFSFKNSFSKSLFESRPAFGFEYFFKVLLGFNYMFPIDTFLTKNYASLDVI